VMRVFDCFIMKDEVDLLKIRMNELKDCVDVFVIVEANKTFSGKDKLFCAEALCCKFNLNLGKQKIRYIKVTDMPKPAVTNYRPDLHRGIKWNGQFHQRNAISRGLYDLEDDDIVMIGDLDEIWSCEKFLKIKSDIRFPMVFEQLPMVGYMNVLQTNSAWYGTMVVNKDFLSNRTLQDLRMMKDGFDKIKGGWHFSWCGGVEAMAEKMKDIGHTVEEVRLSGYDPEKIMRNIEKMDGVVKVDTGMLPRYVRENWEYFKEKGYVL
jgi:beta-1,4-mannosyl-glycoprotein beta-1,4-N-acetylglucosaminyltransferase